MTDAHPQGSASESPPSAEASVTGTRQGGVSGAASELEQIIERLDRLEAMLERAITAIENIPVDDPYY